MVLSRRVALLLTFSSLLGAAGCRDLLPRQFEYEEELYLAIDACQRIRIEIRAAQCGERRH